MKRHHRKPTLVCVSNGNETVTRYIPKQTGGFFTERFAVIDRDEFNKSCTPETIKRVRLGHMADQEYPENTPEVA